MPANVSIHKDARATNIEIELIVVDNGSRDSTLKKLKELEEKIPAHVIKLGKNYGTTKSRNIGIAKSKGEFLAFFDADTVIQKSCLKALIKTFKTHKKTGLVAPRLLYPDGSVQTSCKKFPTVKTKLLKFFPLRAMKKIGEKDELYEHLIYSKNFKETREVDYCISATWMMTREALEDVGLFDEKIFYSPEDVDFCIRLWQRGWKVLYNPVASVYHTSQRESYKNPMLLISHIKGLVYYFRKHGYWLNRNKFSE
jgi:GT2 family glycosyltransferase